MTETEQDFQARSVAEGKKAQDLSEMCLRGAGFQIVARDRLLKDLGVTMNFVAQDEAGNEWYFDTSGSFTSNRPGLMRTDTVWKTLGRASVMSAAGFRRLIILTTHLPAAGSAGSLAMRAARETFFDAIEIPAMPGKIRLRHYAKGVQLPLPLSGIRTPTDTYARRMTSPAPFGAKFAIPVPEIGDPVPLRVRVAVSALPFRLKVFMPSTAGSGAPLDPTVRKAALNRVKGMLSALAGGCTTVDGHGSWIDPIRGVVDEDVSAIEAYSSLAYPAALIEEIVRVILGDLAQKAAAMIVNDQMLMFEA